VPRLSDLRESGAIEQDADVVILLRREGIFPREELIMDVAKNRHGETGEIRLHWDGRYSRAVSQ
jgi:replicative DNA helicase